MHTNQTISKMNRRRSELVDFDAGIRREGKVSLVRRVAIAEPRSKNCNQSQSTHPVPPANTPQSRPISCLEVNDFMSSSIHPWKCISSAHFLHSWCFSGENISSWPSFQLSWVNSSPGALRFCAQPFPSFCLHLSCGTRASSMTLENLPSSRHQSPTWDTSSTSSGMAIATCCF